MLDKLIILLSNCFKQHFQVFFCRGLNNKSYFAWRYWFSIKTNIKKLCE